MKVLITGSGGREHALAWKTQRDPQVTQVFVAPGNAGTALEGCINVEIDVMDFDAQIAFAQEQGIDLTIIGPEDPLVAGAVDAFEAAGLRCFGPNAAAAQLEGSKTFTKDFLRRHRVPTAAYGSFDKVEAAVAFAEQLVPPVVIKADGLAAGKGVIVALDHGVAADTIRDMLSGNAFGNAGSRVVVEEFLRGEEVSFIVAADGDTYVPFVSSQDHKPVHDGDEGPNTGGMGAYAPAPVVDEVMHRRICSQVIEPVLRGMAAEGNPYRGFLYAGLMISPDGVPNVIEFNCRFGDPETQPIMFRMRSSLPELCNAALDGKLGSYEMQADPRAVITVVMASGGYPGSYAKGDEITGLQEAASNSADVKVFHAGTSMEGKRVLTNGGRVLGVTAAGETVSEAQRRAYAAVDAISWPGAFARRDIGYRAVAREVAED